MNDELTTGEYFREVRKLSQEKRANNREESATILTNAHIKFETRNEGAHLVIESKPYLVYFWPGTGKWIVRGNGWKGRGVHELLRYLKKAAEKVKN